MPKIRLLPHGVPLISVADDYTATLTNQVIAADASGVGVSPLIVQLPQVGTSRSFEIVVANVGASGTVTVDAFGAETIDGLLTYDLTAQWDAVTLTSVPGGWVLSAGGGGGGGPIALDDLTDVTITAPSLFDSPFYDDVAGEWVNLRGQRANTQYHGGFFGLTGNYTITDGTSFLAVAGSMDAGAGEDTLTLPDAVLNSGQMLTIINLTDAGYTGPPDPPPHNITIQCAGTDIFPSGLTSVELGVGSVIEFSSLGAVGPFTVWIPGIRSGFDYDIPYFNGIGVTDGEVVKMTGGGTTPSWVKVDAQEVVYSGGTLVATDVEAALLEVYGAIPSLVPPAHPSITVVNEWTPSAAFTSGSVVLVDDLIYYVPIFLAVDTYFDDIAIDHVAGTAGALSTFWIGIYEDNGGVPGNRLVSYNDIDLTTAAAFKTRGGFTPLVLSAGLWWLACTANLTSGSPELSTGPAIAGSVTSTDGTIGCKTEAGAGSLPATATPSATATADTPIIYLLRQV